LALPANATVRPVAGEVEGVGFDFGILTDVNEADVAIRHHGFDFEMTVGRDHDEQSLGWRDAAAGRVHGKLLHGSVDRRFEKLEHMKYVMMHSIAKPDRIKMGTANVKHRTDVDCRIQRERRHGQLFR